MIATCVADDADLAYRKSIESDNDFRFDRSSIDFLTSCTADNFASPVLRTCLPRLTRKILENESWTRHIFVQTFKQHRSQS